MGFGACLSVALRALCCAALLMLLGACAQRSPAPIEDHSHVRGLQTQRYTVLRGDTLFAIAFRYGLDYRRLAAANGISKPYTIFPGQVLRLAEASVQQASVAAPAGKPKATPSASAPNQAVAQGSSSSARASGSDARGTSEPKPAVKSPPAQTGTAAEGGSSARSGAVSSSTTSSTGSSRTTPTPRGPWQWPAAGRVSRGFDGTLHKGIDISGARGSTIKAAAGGRVAYAGSGIAGYGLMLIVRHDDEYLSAYGHNDALLVKEGDVVRAGQAIAKRGSSGTDTVKLHFEIRRAGRPVDPLKLLPRR